MLNQLTKIMIVALFFALNLNAQQGPPKVPDGEEVEKMVDELTVELSLNDEVKQKISDLFADHFESATEIMSGKGSRENQRAEMDALRQDFEKQVKELLTDEQREKFDEFMKSRRPQQGKRPPRRR